MKLKHIAIIFFWEFIQNLPAVVCLLIGAELWPRPSTFLLALAGGLGSALVIAWTEHYKDPGYREPFRMLVTNAIGFSIMIFLVAVFLNRIHGLVLDLLLGLLIGAMVACIQNLAQNKTISLRHVLAIGLASSVALTLVAFIDRSGIGFPLKVLIVNGLTSGIIVVVDYVIGLGDPKTKA
jgi:hypothetical protein